MTRNKKYVCLGGGIGTVNVLRGLKNYTKDITVVVSMADDGASGGRLRRLFSIPPPGDLMNCLAALSEAEPILKELLTYRFKGNRWGRDDSLEGQKLGNLILVALVNLTGNFEAGLIEAQRIFSTHGKIMPATNDNVSIWAITTDGKKVYGEENIDLGKYDGHRSLRQVLLKPKNPSVPKQVIEAITKADVIITGPGDLYTTVLPVLLVPKINQALKESKAKKMYILNVANKPFETPNYKVSDYLTALNFHLGFFPFHLTLMNKNFNPKMPKKLKYTYVSQDGLINKNYRVIRKDLVDEKFPLYHDVTKLAKNIIALS